MAMLLEPGMQSLRMGANGERCPTPSPPGSPGTPHDSCSIAPLTPSQSPRSEARSQQTASFAVVVAIDFGTTSSGYAFSFSSDPEAIHMMRKWEGGDPGVANQKTPTSLLLTPEGVFHSFGYTARDYYHDLDPEEARDWLYFEKFKMKIHSTSDLTMKTELEAVNGKKMQALEVFAHALRFFKQHAVQELKDQCPSLPERDAIRWVITVPAIWKQPAKQFMREAAYKAGLVSPENPEQLLIALEPEAASIYCRKLRLHQLIDLSCKPPANGLAPDHSIDSSFRQDDLLKKPEVQGIKFLFLVGGFAESAMLQHAVQAAFGPTCRVIIPQDVGLTILKGAVLFGLDPTIVRVRRSPLTYGVGVLNKFVEGKHPREKLLVKEGKNWCTDIFEKFVSVDQSVALGEVVQRSYCPARPGQRKTIINIYCCATDDVVYITDPGVRKCGTISLELEALGDAGSPARPGVRKCGTISLELEALGDAGSPARGRRETRPSMQFGDTEIKSPAMDIRTSKTVRATI
ncbi:PREDICTED: heat shock 70 kDa protein 12B, partial [Aptenodytes forsteri]|uniref:heat shock 70 kDa protein 12B n=1 Tax=Aptenodytes forsteri TaxID=9233 RepID=UPI000904F5AB